jgi:RRXRR protein
VCRYPFTIRLKNRVGGEVQPVRINTDPGSNTTGIAVVTDADGDKPAKVLCLFELCRRGRQISEALTARQKSKGGAKAPAFRPGWVTEDASPATADNGCLIAI